PTRPRPPQSEKRDCSACWLQHAERLLGGSVPALSWRCYLTGMLALSASSTPACRDTLRLEVVGCFDEMQESAKPMPCQRRNVRRTAAEFRSGSQRNLLS
ncbi:hypothetical protein, partial [Xanthomonas hortorum]|uniref:hypothetical protein n=1 Tax=Xanthomonas hortorum TaxID=56454 RepID=UPI003ED876A8